MHRLVGAADFFTPGHDHLYTAMLHERENVGADLDLITVSHMLARLGLIDETDRLLGEPVEEYLAGLWRDSFAVAGCLAYAKVVREYADRRAAIETGTRMVAEAYNSAVKPHPIRGGVE